MAGHDGAHSGASFPPKRKMTRSVHTKVKAMPGHQGTVFFWFDVDNTLLNMTLYRNDIRRSPGERIWPPGSRAVLGDLETLRSELGYADYLGALNGYRNGGSGKDPHLLRMSGSSSTIRSESRLYPGAAEGYITLPPFVGPTLSCRTRMSVFQPRKVTRSGSLGCR